MIKEGSPVLLVGNLFMYFPGQVEDGGWQIWCWWIPIKRAFLPSLLSHSKDSSYTYSQPDQGMSQHNFPCSVHQYESSGSVNDDSSELLDSQVQYSAEPHLYGNATHEHPSTQDQGNHLAEECLSSDEGTPPSIKKIIHVLEKVQYLEQEVEEFVGKKTDKAYWLLEEMLTKELLELDSVETGGQDSIRQARKEAVCKIQAILEKLEKKGLWGDLEQKGSLLLTRPKNSWFWLITLFFEMPVEDKKQYIPTFL